MTRTTSLAACICLTLLHPTFGLAEGELMQVRQDFSADPGWEAKTNRIVAADPPTVTQDFGWKDGRIGGTVWQSRTAAWYGLPFGSPINFEQALSASGKIAVKGGRPGAAAYIGFFNHQRQEWRPWNSMGLRIVCGQKEAAFYQDYMSAQWGGSGAESNCAVPVDGSEHTWRFAYDPLPGPPQWTDLKLKEYLLDARQSSEEIYEKARQAEPELTLEQLERRLTAALAEGLVSFYPRWGKHLWTLQHHDDVQGMMSLQIDEGLVYKNFILKEHRGQPLSMDRFGIFNFQVYHGPIEFYVAELTVNGHKIDLSKDPGWEGRGNRVTFLEQDFQRQNFGYSETAWCGSGIGEAGGLFCRTEPIDPLHGYYGDDIGTMTLDDPISFSGKICFVNGGTDAGMFFGYFNSQEEGRELTDPKAKTMANTLGVKIDGPTRVGYFFSPRCMSSDNRETKGNRPVYLPDAKAMRFAFNYDPLADNGVGRVTATLGDEKMEFELNPKQRKAGARFDRFGLMNVRHGGKYVTVYFDDFEYTARRSANYKPVHHRQKVLAVPYPPGGRKY